MFRSVRRFISYLNSHIRFKIILPFAILTLVVAITGVYLSVRLVAGPLEQRFEGELIEAGRVVANGIAQREQLHLSALRTIAFTEGIDQALINGDREQLQTWVFPIVANSSINRVDVISADGRHLLAIYRPPGTSTVGDYTAIDETELVDWSNWPIVQKVLNGVVDSQGDKYVTLATVDGNGMFFTAGPVKQGEAIVGAVLVSSYTDDLLRSLRQLTSAEINLYDLKERLINTTLPNRDEEIAAAMAIGSDEAHLLLALEGEFSRQRSVSLGETSYDLLFGVFWARGEPLGFYSVTKEASFTESITAARNLMVLTFAITLLLVFGIGYVTANAITGRVQHLMENAMAVAKGDYSRRMEISSSDEIGLLASSLDDMTQSLASKIYELTVLHESSTAMTGPTGLNLDYILQALAISVKGVIQGIDQVIVHLLDDSGQMLVPRVATSNNVNAFPALNFAKEDEMRTLLAVARPQIINLSDLIAYTPDQSFSPNGDIEILMIPLIAGQETIGALTLISDAAYTYDQLLNEDSQRLLGTLANQAAIAIKNAQLFEATQRAYEELRQVDDLKTEFINISAHELRTPLGGMITSASFVEKRAPPKLHKHMRFLVVSMLRMRTIVDAMLTIQRLDAGTAFLRRTSVDIRDIFKKVITDSQPMAELEGHVITVNLPDKLPIIEVDADKIGLVLSNLLSNAIKFTPEGGRIEVAAQDYVKGILISVRDNGVGIAAEDQERIFERFYQARAEHIAGHGGMGLGLTIVKHLVELHEGQVWVESEIGQGSTFFFTLPYVESVDTADSSPSLTTDTRPHNEKERLLKIS